MQQVCTTLVKLSNNSSSFFRVVSHSGPQGPDLHTCDCISGPRRIPAVGVTRYTPCAHCRTWVYHIRGMLATTPPWILGSESPNTARARRSPFGCKFKGREVSSPTHPAHPDCPSFQIGRQKPAQSRRTIGAQWCTSHIRAARKRRHRC